MREIYRPPDVVERTTGHAGELQLQRRGNAYELICNGVFLMASYNGAGEREMVRAVLQAWEEQSRQGQAKEGCAGHTGHAGLQAQPFVCLLVGGLGFGLGLQEALRSPLVARVDLLELEEAVIRWNREVLQEVNGNALSDPRVQVFQEDIVLFLEKTGINAAPPNGVTPDERDAQTKKGRGIYHGIILDTDNGPDWLSRSTNHFLYRTEGTALMHKLLLPGGILSVWSASPVASYFQLLQQHFPVVLEKTVLEKTGQTSYYYLAFKAAH